MIERIKQKVGIDEEKEEKEVGMIIELMKKEGKEDKVKKMMEEIKGEEEEVQKVKGGGLMQKIVGGVMGIGKKIMGEGIGMGEI